MEQTPQQPPKRPRGRPRKKLTPKEKRQRGKKPSFSQTNVMVSESVAKAAESYINQYRHQYERTEARNWLFNIGQMAKWALINDLKPIPQGKKKRIYIWLKSPLNHKAIKRLVVEKNTTFSQIVENFLIFRLKTG